MRAENLDLAELIYMASVYRRRKFYSEAIDLLTEALHATQGKRNSRHDAIVQYSLARVYEEQGNGFFARELYDQALSDWLGKKTVNPFYHLWPHGSLRSLESACQQLIYQGQQASDMQNLPLPAAGKNDRWLRAS